MKLLQHHSNDRARKKRELLYVPTDPNFETFTIRVMTCDTLEGGGTYQISAQTHWRRSPSLQSQCHSPSDYSLFEFLKWDVNGHSQLRQLTIRYGMSVEPSSSGCSRGNPSEHDKHKKKMCIADCGAGEWASKRNGSREKKPQIIHKDLNVIEFNAQSYSGLLVVAPALPSTEWWKR